MMANVRALMATVKEVKRQLREAGPQQQLADPGPTSTQAATSDASAIMQNRPAMAWLTGSASRCSRRELHDMTHQF